MRAGLSSAVGFVCERGGLHPCTGDTCKGLRLKRVSQLHVGLLDPFEEFFFLFLGAEWLNGEERKSDTEGEEIFHTSEFAFYRGFTGWLMA